MTKSLQRRRPPKAALLVIPAAALLILRIVAGHRDLGGFDTAIYYYGAAKRFLDGVNPYSLIEVVVPPSGMLVVAPLRLVSFDVAAIFMQIVSAVSLVTSGYLLLRRFADFEQWKALAVSTAVVAIAAPAYSTTGVGNLNGVLLLTFVMALLASQDGDERATGLWMGAGIALKPVLAPIWIVLLIQRRWKAAGWSVAIPAVGTIAAAIYNPHVLHFFDDGIKSILTDLSDRFPSWDIAVGSLVRVAKLPDALTSVGRLGVAALTVVIAVMTYRLQDHETTDATVRTRQWIELGSILFLGYLLAASYAWRYYTIYLAPLFVLSMLRDSIARNWLVWIGAVLVLFPDDSGTRSDHKGWDAALSTFRQTSGVALMLLGLGFGAYLLLRRNRLRAQ